MLPQTSVTFQTANAAIQRLFDTAESRCLDNLQMFGPHQVLVEGGGYEKIWLETQPMGGEMYAKRNLTAAVNNSLLFMDTQRADGRLAGSIQCLPDGSIEAQFNKFQGFCFPDAALNLYWWLKQDRNYLRKLQRCLIRFDEYLWRTRDSDGDGCLESFCVYDTGEDNALRYGDAPVYCTTDTPPEGSSIVPMASMDVMSFSYAARDTLAEISAILQDGQEARWQNAARQVASGLKARLWNEEKGACFDQDRFGEPIPVLTHNNLRCMYWGSFSPDMAMRFVNEHLLNPAEFWTPMPLCSVAANDPAFRNTPENNWSGQPEGLTYQRAIRALERYGCEPLVTRLGHRLMQAVMEGGYLFTQQFDPFTGAPSRVSTITKEPLLPGSSDPIQDSYGPTLLAVLEYIAHIWGVHMHRGQLWFSLGSGDPYTYQQQWDNQIYRIESDGQFARIFINGKEITVSPCGRRLITDTNGRLIATRTIETHHPTTATEENHHDQHAG